MFERLKTDLSSLIYLNLNLTLKTLYLLDSFTKIKMMNR